jgi:hypothetical protein
VTILPILHPDHNKMATAMRYAATHLLDTASDCVRATEPAAHAMLEGLRRANLPSCTYGAVTCALGVMAFLAWKERKLEKAHDHALHAFASLILAIIHMLG